MTFDNLAPITKPSAGSTGKSGVSPLGKNIGTKSGGSGSKLSSMGSTSNKAKSSNFGSTASKSSNFGSSASKTSNFGSSPSKTSSFGSSASKTSTFGSTASKASDFGSGKTSNLSPMASKSGNFSSTASTASKTSSFSSTASKTNTFGSTPSKPSSFGAYTHGKDNSSSRTPSFFGGESAKASTGHTPSTSRNAYEHLSFTNPKNEKSRGFGIIWIPGRKRNKKKDQVFSSLNYDRNERKPTMYNIMSGDSPDFQVHKRRDEESTLLVPDKLKGPIATVASAGTASVINELPSITPASELEEKLLNHDKEDTKEAAGDATNKEESEYLENDKIPEHKPDKTADKVDSVFVSPPVPMKPPPEQTSGNQNDDDCIITCLYYTIQCCDCVLM